MNIQNKIISISLVLFFCIPSYAKGIDKKVDDLLHKALLLSKLELSKHKTIRSWVEKSEDKYKVDRRIIYGRFYDVKIPPIVINKNKLLMFNRMGFSPDILELKVVKNKFVYFYNGLNITPKEKELEKDWILRTFPQLKPKKYSYIEVLGNIIFPKAHAAVPSMSVVGAVTAAQTYFFKKMRSQPWPSDSEYEAIKDLGIDAVRKGYGFKCFLEKGKHSGVSFSLTLNDKKVFIQSKPTKAPRYVDLALLDEQEQVRGTLSTNHESQSTYFTWFDKSTGKTLSSLDKDNKHMAGAFFFDSLNFHEKASRKINTRELGLNYQACKIKKKYPEVECSGGADDWCWSNLRRSLRIKLRIKFSDDDLIQIEKRAKQEGSLKYKNLTWLQDLRFWRDESFYIDEARKRLTDELKNKKEQRREALRVDISQLDRVSSYLNHPQFRGWSSEVDLQEIIEIAFMSPEGIRQKKDDCSKEVLSDEMWALIQKNRKFIARKSDKIKQVDNLLVLAEAGTACCRNKRCKQALVGEIEIYNKIRNKPESTVQ